MSNAKLTMNVRQAAEDICILDIEGDVSGFAENTMMDAYTQASSLGAKAIILNFSGLAYMNSSGIGLLVTLLIRAQREGQKLLAYGLSDHYQQIFSLTRLDEAIGIYGDESEALAAVKSVVP